MTRRRATSLAVVLLGSLALAVSTAVPSPQSGGISRPPQRFRGHVMPSRQVELRAPIEELLHAIDVEEGEQVETGRVLARLDDRLQVTVVEAARVAAESKAEVQAATLDLEEAKENQRRVTGAFDRKAASDVELDRARIAVGRAEAARTEALENQVLAGVKLRMEEQRLSRHRVVAPFDGTVVRVVAEAGAMLTAEDTILTLVDLATLEANINLPAALYGQLTVGSPYALIAEQPVNGELEATLKTVEPIIDTASQTFRCVFSIANEDTRLPAGFTVSLLWPPPTATPVVQATDDTE